jgi:hypothetical protein
VVTVNPNALMARVKQLPSPEVVGERRASVELHGERSVVLLPGRRAAAWRSMLEFTQTYGLPAYIEADPESNAITRVLIPARATVRSLEPTPEGDVTVHLRESQARHTLLRRNADFADLLDSLEAARQSADVVLVTSSRDDHEIIDVREAPPAPGTGPPLDDPPPSVVTEAQAIQLFNDMAATTCNPVTVPPPCIPFLYPDDGCYARAHEMVRLMRVQGIEAEKVWIYGSLNPATTSHPDCEVGWGWHVAPTLQVQTAGGIEKRVIDPSLMTGPASPDDWRTRQDDPGATLEYTDATPFWSKYSAYAPDDASYSLTIQYLAEKRAYLADRSSQFGPPPYACPIVKSAHFIVDRSTFGQDEATALLGGANPAVVQAALYFVLDGFTPAEVGITGSTPTNPPTLKPTLNVNPGLNQIELRAAHLDLEDPVHLIRRQRITWTYEVRFTGTADFNFAAETEAVALAASFAGEAASASLTLIKQPNPYEIDGATSWLSTDLRVFQINAGQSRFNATMGAGAGQAPAFIQQVINNLNSAATGGQTFDTALSVDQQQSKLELSEAVGGVKVFNFAVARVRYVGTLQAQDVRVFFRLFPASTTSLAFDVATTYRRGGAVGSEIALLGLESGALVTIPCFAASRVDSSTTALTAQPDAPNVRTLAASPTERQAFFGAWLDINQTSPQFPLNPNPPDGPFASGRKSVYELVRSAHQCLVAEIAFDPAPIGLGAGPSTSDKLAQRNLAIVESANPGVVGSRRIPQTFELRPTPEGLPEEATPDELLIDWGSTPVGSVASIYLPEFDADEITAMAAQLYRTDAFVAVDEHTLQTATGGMSWLPIPRGRTNVTGLLTIDLPGTVRAGQAFTVVARQVTGRRVAAAPAEGMAIAAFVERGGRRILGTFQVTIPVRTRSVLLVPATRLLANLRWIERSIPATDRWYATFRRYASQMADRVDGLGGDSGAVEASPSGDAAPAGSSLVCQMLQVAVVVLLALLIALGAIGGASMLLLGFLDVLALVAVLLAWSRACRPTLWRVVGVLAVGLIFGGLLFALLLAVGP